MKTKNLFAAILLVLVIAGALGVFYSCTKDKVNIETPRDENYALTHAGALHNAALVYYFENRQLLKSTSSVEEILDEALELTSRFLVGEGFDTEKVMDVKFRINSKLGDLAFKSSSVDEICLDTASFISQMSNIEILSSEFVKEMDQFLSFAHNANTLEEISDFVNNHFAKLEFLNPYDVTAQKVYVDIYNNSCNYWRDSSKKCNLNSLWPKPSSWVIINDGIGAILASPLGPIGSITLGTIFSVGTNEEIGQE